ncbi:helix-turn-helix transcriptional regulator [Sphaerochaeta sp. S2]|uniref:helix-turn-helix transcriptional regulator n=1 Tax=Sphaerochaeta sp. S2 TaxID=2798868 RepID=UPI0018E9778C|nr:helix-turn-helix transcriptional regulator [Sphaerochaeta sp. S2]MBJ2354835.1 helix-turn-helix transcriptional regulator [Sphaerochaeta sp. S2]
MEITFWDRLLSLLKAHRLTQSKFCKEVDVLPSYLSTALKRRSAPTAEFAYKVSKRFGVSLSWLIAGEDENAIDVKFAPVVQDDRVMEIAYNLKNCCEDYITIIEQLVVHEVFHAKRV